MKDWFLLILFIVVFVIMPIFTFGYAYNHNKYCKTPPFKDDPFCACGAPLVAATFWPLYWSAELQKEAP